jgi:hypothetical protein
MKTAIIIAGATRQTHLTYRFWDQLPQGDLYYSTWDVSQQTYDNTLYSIDRELKKLTSQINFKEVIVSNYQTEYLDRHLHPFMRPFYLLRKVHEQIKNQGYQRVIYFRPDIKLFYTEDYNPKTDFEVSHNSIKILGDHWPEAFWVPETRVMNDLFFVFPWNIFELFLNNAEFICRKEIHNSLFEFFDLWRIKVEPLYTMRCVILRNNVDESNINLGQDELTKLFLDVFVEKDHLSKFSFAGQCSFSNKKEIDTEYLEYSRNNGGILKLRKQ